MILPIHFDYPLSPESIAQTPASPRDSAKLMVVNRRTKTITHHIFRDIIDFLTPNDVLVLNDTKVFPARLTGTKQTGGKTEVLLIRPINSDTWEAMGKNLKPGQHIDFSHNLCGQVIAKHPTSGHITVKLNHSELVDQIGQTPIPPYIHSPLPESKLRTEYQTVYANQKGSAAAPTAGMHFTQPLLDQIQSRGVQLEKVTLHVGPGTFAKLTPENIQSKQLHHEWYSITPDTAARLTQAKTQGKRIVAVGTTSCRTLESAYSPISKQISAGQQTTNLFIMPGYQFNFVDTLVTNFHLPQSSLLMLVTAFCHASTFKNSLVDTAYQTAINNHYRFFSFGDAMLIE